MVADLVVTGLEVLIVGFIAVCTARRPKLCGSLALAVAVSLGYIYSLHIFGGSAVAGKETMTAAVYATDTAEGYRVEQVPVPWHTDRMIMIKVEAAGLNPSNFKMVMAKVPFVRILRRWVIGYDVSGVVVSKGNDPACDVKVGDRVWGMALSGSIAEFAVLSCSELVGMGLIPKRMSFEAAAGLPVAGLTGLAAYERNGLKANENVLVIGAAGGCGMFGVGLAAHAYHANVTGLCSTRNVDLVKSLGAHQVVDYRDKGALQRLEAGGPQFDVIYDTVTSNAPEDPNYEPSMRPLLRAGGRYVAIGPSPDPLDLLRAVLDVPTQLLGLGRIQREGYDFFLLLPSRARVRGLSRMFDKDVLPEVHIDSVISVSSTADIVKAMDLMKSRRTTGKIILKVVAAV